ncbi:MAG TPA: hypothetical protein VIK04_12260 [Solirubrobacteraceae bacterium]
MLGAALGQRVADPRAGQDVGEQAALDRVGAEHRDHVDEQVVRLGRLGDRRVGGGDRAEHLGERRRCQRRAAAGAGDGDPKQAGAVELRQLGPGRDAGAVALGGIAGDRVGELPGRGDRLPVGRQEWYDGSLSRRHARPARGAPMSGVWKPSLY